MASPRVWICSSAAVLLLLVFSSASPALALEAENAGDAAAPEAAPEAVLTLDASNFDEAIAKHPFIVVEFYAPWCGHCKKLAPEYEKAASILSKHDPPIVLAKLDANEEQNKAVASKYEVQGFPTIKILRNQGSIVQEYKGPRDADGIVEYLKKQVGPASAEIKSPEDVGSLISDEKIFIVGIFPKFSGEEFESFMAVAEKLRSDYEFGHTLDAKLLPRGESTVTDPVVRLLKPFDELVVDFKDFNGEAIENFIQASSLPVVTTFNKDPNNHAFVVKFFNSPNAKAMFFLNFNIDNFEAFNTKYQEVAKNYKDKGVSFLIGDLDASQAAFQYFGLKEDQVPLIIIQENDGKKYLKPHLEPDQITEFLKEYIGGSLKPLVKSEPIPEANNEPVRVVVADNLQDVVFNSGKNVLIEFYAPWCGHCKKLAPILDEVAVSFEKDADVIIAKMGAVSVRFFLHETSFCIVCCHLASGGKEGDEAHRNSDAMEIFSRTSSPRVHSHNSSQKILDHDRIILLGDLNYRISLPEAKTRSLVEQKEWDVLLEKDQVQDKFIPFQIVDMNRFLYQQNQIVDKIPPNCPYADIIAFAPLPPPPGRPSLPYATGIRRSPGRRAAPTSQA